MHGIEHYKSINANTASPYYLIQMLFEKFIFSTEQAILAIENNNVEEKAAAVSKSIAILGLLEESLNLDDGGQLAGNLKSTYIYCRDCLMEATSEHKIEKLTEAKDLITIIQSGWREIEDKSTPDS